jgi:hypothetical protein
LIEIFVGCISCHRSCDKKKGESIKGPVWQKPFGGAAAFVQKIRRQPKDFTYEQSLSPCVFKSGAGLRFCNVMKIPYRSKAEMGEKSSVL